MPEIKFVTMASEEFADLVRAAMRELYELEAAATEADHIAEALGGSSGTGTLTMRNIDTDALAEMFGGSVSSMGSTPTPPKLDPTLRSLAMAIESAALQDPGFAEDSDETARTIAENFLAYLDSTRQIIVSTDALDRLNAWANFAVDIVERAGDRGKVSRTWIENRRPYHTPPTAADERSLYDFEP
jgi:hypothetical protein